MINNNFRLFPLSYRHLPLLVVLCYLPLFANIAVATPTETEGILSLIERRLVDSADWEVIDAQFFNGGLEGSMTYPDTSAEYGVGYVYRHRQMPAKRIVGTIDRTPTDFAYTIVVPVSSLLGTEELILVDFEDGPDFGAMILVEKDGDSESAYEILLGSENTAEPSLGAIVSIDLDQLGADFSEVDVDLSSIGPDGLLNNTSEMALRLFLADVWQAFDPQTDGAGSDIEWDVERINEFDTPSSLITYSQGAYTDRIDVTVGFAASDKYTESYFKSGSTSVLGYRKLPMPTDVQLTEQIDHVQLSWTPVSGVPKMAIFRSESNTKPSHPIATVDA